MTRAFQRKLVSALVVLFGLAAGSVWAQSAPTSPKKQVVLQKGPRLFVPNAGQWLTPEVARLVLNEVTVHVEQDALVFSVRVPDSIRPSDATAAVAYQWAVRQHFVGASPNVQWELDSSGLASGVEHHFYLGSQSAYWRTGVPGGSRLIGKGLYPGVDLVLEVINDQLKSTWVAARGSDLAAVSVEWLGASDGRLTSDGGAAVRLGKDWAQETAPTASAKRLLAIFRRRTSPPPACTRGSHLRFLHLQRRHFRQLRLLRHVRREWPDLVRWSQFWTGVSQCQRISVGVPRRRLRRCADALEARRHRLPQFDLSGG